MPKIKMYASAEGNIRIERGEDDWPDHQHKYNSWTLRPDLIVASLRYEGDNRWTVTGGSIRSFALKKDGTVGAREVRDQTYGQGTAAFPDWAQPIVDKAVEDFTGQWASLLEEQG
jgi:hypothetical protein